MSVAEPTAPGAEAEANPEFGGPASSARPAPKRRPLHKRAMHFIRRAHLYTGLFLVPWVVLYGVTGFLFNHPTAFSDAPVSSFGKSELAGTPMEAPPKPVAVAEQVVAALNERAKDGAKYSLTAPEKARYTRDFAFATVKTGEQEINLLFDVNNPGGTVRTKTGPAPTPKSEEKAPFAIGNTKGGSPKGGRGGAKGGEKTSEKNDAKTDAPTRAPNTLALPESLHERVKDAVPTVLARTGFQEGDVTVTSVPDLSFQMSDGAKVWVVTYNAKDGTVSGVPADSIPPPDELSTRRFLTRMHLAHGYPGGTNAKWFWAVIVDAMAFVMVFWGISGLFMWWQLKGARLAGFAVLLCSATAAIALGFGMHDLLLPK